MSASSSENVANTRYVPHKTLKTGTTYAVMQDDTNWVLGAKLVITKVQRVMDKDGKPAYTPNGEPMWTFNFQAVPVLLRKEEWQTHKQLDEKEGYGD